MTGYLKYLAHLTDEGDGDAVLLVSGMAAILRANGDQRARSIELCGVLTAQEKGSPNRYVVQTPLLGKEDAWFRSRADAVRELGRRVIRALTRPCPVCNDQSRADKFLAPLCSKCNGAGIVPVEAEAVHA